MQSSKPTFRKLSKGIKFTLLVKQSQNMNLKVLQHCYGKRHCTLLHKKQDSDLCCATTRGLQETLVWDELDSNEHLLNVGGQTSPENPPLWKLILS
jgi:hypothetical protein